MIQSLLGRNRYRRLLREGQVPPSAPTALLEIEVLANDIARTADQIKTAIAKLRAQDHLTDEASTEAHRRDGGQK